MKATHALFGLPLVGLPILVGAAIADPPAQRDVRDPQRAVDRARHNGPWVFAVEPAPLSDAARKGLAWLVEMQRPDGGWSQGEESAHMGRVEKNAGGVSNVADTCVATLALIRASGNSCRGEYAPPIERALTFLCTEIEQSETESLFITSVLGTRTQSKLGQFVDTFFAAMVLAEALNQVQDQDLNRRVHAALDRVIDKIERHQGEDGRFQNNGWAPTLSQAMAAKGLNRAAQAGGDVAPAALQRAQRYASEQFDEGKGEFDRDGAAGVELYAAASATGGLRDASNTNAKRVDELRERANSDDAAVAGPAQEELAAIEALEDKRQAAEKALVAKMTDQAFMAGFGSNGGEEFLSYLNLAESLVIKGGEDWIKWRDSMNGNLERVQNQDGSWTGHHCITGRTFCTSTALLVLLADRTPAPVELVNPQPHGPETPEGEDEAG